MNLKIFATTIDPKVEAQLKELTDLKEFEDCKIRVMPDCHPGSGCVIGFTADLGGKVIPNIVGSDIGCLDRDTEFLTEHGWKSISSYTNGDKVLQYNKDTDTAYFVEPINYIVKECDEFIHFKNIKGLDQMLSDEHKMLIWKGYKNRGYNLVDFRADKISKLDKKLKSGYYGVKTSFTIDNGDGISITDNEVRLDVMIAADGSIKHKRDKEHQIYLHLRKERKIKRAKELLEINSLEYKETLGKDGSTHIYFFIDKKFNKDLSKYWTANKDQLKILSEESLLWDGHTGYRSFFSSTDKKNADIVQFAFASVNIRAGISTINLGIKNRKWSDIYIVKPARNNIIGITNTFTRVKSLDGKKYCFTVPTGYFVARRNGKIFITGNCGMLTVELGNVDIDLAKLDEVIKDFVPNGFKIHESSILNFDRLEELRCYKKLKNIQKIHNSLGTLGSGNHFLEIDVDTEGNKYLVIHTGSRNLGAQVSKYYQDLAIEFWSFKDARALEKKESIERLKLQGRVQEINQSLKNIDNKYNHLVPIIPKDLSYLILENKEDYLHDMSICQEFATRNRIEIAIAILSNYFKKNIILTSTGITELSNNNMEFERLYDSFETIHNYIDIDTNIVRKGAVSAKKGKQILIPINMRDGCIIAVGKGNDDWNQSAPHGAGRLMSRTQAKEFISLEEAKDSMSGIYTSSINASTIDEAPMAYKPMQEIIDNIGDTVEILKIIKPIYNFKASEEFIKKEVSEVSEE